MVFNTDILFVGLLLGFLFIGLYFLIRIRQSNRASSDDQAYRNNNGNNHLAAVDNQKGITTVLFILFALPIPISLLSLPWTLMAIFSIDFTYSGNPNGFISNLLFLFVMLLGGNYLITYIISIILTRKARRLSALSFLPVIHGLLFYLLYSIAK